MRKIPVQTPEERRERKRLRSARLYAALSVEKKAERRAQAKEWKRENREICMLMSARGRAAKAGIPFNIDVEDIVIPEKCPALGIELKSNMIDSRAPLPNSPSLDRLIPSLGYTKGNVVVISHLANTIKSYATPSQVMAVAVWMKENIPE